MLQFFRGVVTTGQLIEIKKIVLKRQQEEDAAVLLNCCQLLRFFCDSGGRKVNHHHLFPLLSIEHFAQVEEKIFFVKIL